MLTLEYKPVSWLRLSTQFGMQLENSKTEKFADQDSYYVRKYRQYTEYGSYNNKKYFLPDGGIIQNWDDEMSQ